MQILVEGSYNGILKPNVHYIELKQNFSNIDEVLSSLNDEARRSKIAEDAYVDIVLSNKYTYRNMIQDIVKKVNLKSEGTSKQWKMNFFYLLHNFIHQANIIFLFFFTKLRAFR